MRTYYECYSCLEVQTAKEIEMKLHAVRFDEGNYEIRHYCKKCGKTRRGEKK